ncbi:MAG: redoxin family protein [Campylobacterota bacterium]|nr:redoxin family protein [Campylobacterota bacterium]
MKSLYFFLIILTVTLLRADYSQDSEKKHTFVLTNIDKEDLNITILNETTLSANIDKPLLLINFFATWSPPCRGEVNVLNQLQKSYTKELFIVGVTINDDQNRTKAHHLSEIYNSNYFISDAPDNSLLINSIIKSLKLPSNFPTPLTILYIDGELYRYYEGAMPIEMMEYEIKQAIKQL